MAWAHLAQVTFLHLFHHASITVIVGSLLPFGAWVLMTLYHS
jgi:hypothetical protein